MKISQEEIVGNNKDIIEIVSSDIALELLNNSGNNNLKICLPLELNIGKLKKYMAKKKSVILLMNLLN